jgi:hypothetical protein
VALAGTLASAYFQYSASERASDVRMVEIGIGILRAPVSEDIAVIRGWALDLIEKSSGLKFDSNQRRALLRNSLPYVEGRSWIQQYVPDPCAAFRHNSDGSWTQTGKVILPGNNVLEGNTFKNTGEAHLLDQLCGHNP